MAVSMLLMLSLFLLPLLVVTPFRGERSRPTVERETAEPVPQQEDRDLAVTLRIKSGETVQEMTLRDYLIGVVRAEMPASFETEALRAQAVAARTYTLYQIANGGKHGDEAQLCTESTCCQAYLDAEEARRTWGENAEIYAKKTADAVADTDGDVILYGGVPILAAFHASSAGLTRAAGEVWVSDLPYLQAVSSPEDGAGIPDYYSRVAFSREDFRDRVTAAYPETKLTGEMAEWLRNAVVDEAGSVETICVGGIEVKGSELRGILGLRSACFTWEVQEKDLVFFVTGYGHGVGLSQYGANAMAGAGKTYREILTHYYTGVTVESYSAAGQPFTNAAAP